jgi:hypothetical protein
VTDFDHFNRRPKANSADGILCPTNSAQRFGQSSEIKSVSAIFQKRPARGSVNRINCEQGHQLLYPCASPGMSNESDGGNYR